MSDHSDSHSGFLIPGAPSPATADAEGGPVTLFEGILRRLALEPVAALVSSGILFAALTNSFAGFVAGFVGMFLVFTLASPST